jgi:hypothetical protein
MIMEYDFAILYFGMTRSVRKVYHTHIQHIFETLDKHNMTYKKFIHTWKTRDDSQNAFFDILPQKIDYEEHNLLNPDVYTIDNETDFIEGLNIADYFNKERFDQYGDCAEGDWYPQLIQNYVCMLESQKRGFSMVKDCVLNGDSFKYVMFIRPDIWIDQPLPIDKLVLNEETINMPNHSHWDGLNDQFYIMSYKNACLFSHRGDELKDYRQNVGRIVGEPYCKYIVEKLNFTLNEIVFNYTITRP